MNKELLEKRVSELQEAIEKSAANHNALIGRINEAKELFSLFFKDKKEEVSSSVAVEEVANPAASE